MSNATGPFRADQIRDGDPYELSEGHAPRACRDPALLARWLTQAATATTVAAALD